MSESLNAKTDEELLCLLRLDQREAFEVLYERYEKSLYTFILRYVHDAELARDLFQETFLRLYRKSGTYKGRASVKTWLFTIARNLCLDRLSRSRKEVSLESFEGELIISPEATDPEASAERTELSRKVEEALQLLSPAQRELLVLSRIEGMTYPEIARITGSSPGAVKTAAFRALHALRGKLHFQPGEKGEKG